MTALCLVHVSDTHLSPTHGYFAANWAGFAAAMAAAPPDLLVHGGDVAFNGPVAEADLAHGAAALSALGCPWCAIPGNHDIGEAPGFSRLDQPVTPARMAAWQRHIGPQWWVRDFGAWRLVGLDTALFGSDLAEEAAQRDAFRAALASRGDRPVMVFVHMPPFDRDPDDAARGTSVMPHAARQTFLDDCAAGGVVVIACGHLHIYRRMRHRGMQIIWAPPTAMVDVRKGLARWRRLPRPGYVAWQFDGRQATHRLVEPPTLAVIDLTGWTAQSGGTTTTLPALSRG